MAGRAWLAREPGWRRLRVVLLWINGPFGGGKTHAADEIHRRLAGSVICDPEHLGYGLHRMTPPHLRGNFQDMSAWRQGTFEVLNLLLGKHEGAVIVPMTIIDPAYLAEILGPLRENGHPGQALHPAGRARDHPPPPAGTLPALAPRHPRRD